MLPAEIQSDNPILRRLIDNIFDFPYASHGKDANGLFTGSAKYAKDIALGMPILQFNGPWRRKYMAFDIDRDLGGLAWEDANLPIPTIVITNPQNGHAHLVYEIAEPVWFPKSGQRRRDAPPVRYWKAVYKAMAKALDADNGYTGLLAKNPLHRSWRVSCGPVTPYTLGDLAAHLDLVSDTHQTEAVIRDAGGRRATLFETIRWFAYAEKAHHSTVESFHQTISDELDRINQTFAKGPESPSTLRSTAKSVARWTWKNYYRIRDRGVMGLDASEPLPIRQQKGQGYTCILRTDRTLSRIQKAIRFILGEGKRKLTKSLVALQAGLHRNTVQAYWQQVTDFLAGEVSLEGKISSITFTGEEKVSFGGGSGEGFLSTTFTDQEKISFGKVSSQVDSTVTLREETECLRHRSLVTPAGSAPGGIPDATQLCTLRASQMPGDTVAEKVRAFMQQMKLRRQNEPLPDPEPPAPPPPPTLKTPIRVIVDRLYEQQRATQRTGGCISAD